MTYHLRNFADERDYRLMRELLLHIEAASGPLVYCHLGDLDWWRFTEADPDAAIRNTELCFDASGALVAFGWRKDAQVDIITHPAHPAADAALLDSAERAFRAAQPASAPLTFSAWSFEHDQPRNALLAERGYQLASASFNANLRDLSDDPPTIELPAGYRIRHVLGEQDFEARVAAHRDAFSPSRMTVEKHRAVTRAPTYLPELDLVVEAPDGSFAAFALVWLDVVNRSAEFEPVGCHSDHRRRGLTRALLYEGMRRARARGATHCVVYSSGEPRYEASRALYPAAGFRVAGTVREWSADLAAR